MPVFSGAAGAIAGQVQAGQAKEAAKIQRQIFQDIRADAEPFRLLGTDAANFLRGLFFEEGPSAGIFTGQQTIPNPELERLRGELADVPVTAGQQITAPGRADEQGLAINQTTVANPEFDRLRNLIARTPETVEIEGGEPLDFGQVVKEFDPTFGFRQEEGEKAINRALSSRGLFRSGRALKALDEFNSNLALGSSENFLNRLATFSGIGQTTAATLGDQGITSAAIRGNFLLDEGAARASSINSIGNAFGNLFGGLALGGGGGAAACSKRFKIDQGPADAILERVERLPIQTWRYRPELELGTEVHIGPYAEEFHELFNVGDGVNLNFIDLCGVCLAALQEIAIRLRRLETEHA